MKIKIWDPNNESEENAPWVDLEQRESIATAVGRFAEKNWHQNDYWDKCTFNVRTEDGGLIRFSVSTKPSIDFITEQLSRTQCAMFKCELPLLDDSDYCVDHQG